MGNSTKIAKVNKVTELLALPVDTAVVGNSGVLGRIVQEFHADGTTSNPAIQVGSVVISAEALVDFFPAVAVTRVDAP